MSKDYSQSSRRRLTVQLALLEEAEKGNLDDLRCPACDKASVSVWYTNPNTGVYRVWFMCESCDYELRVQCSSCPPHFSQERIHYVKQLYDEKLTANAKFPPTGSGDEHE